MRWIVLIAVAVLALESLAAHVGPLAHAVLLVPLGIWLWLLEVTRRPLRPCTRCDKGRNWDSSRENFGEYCRRCGVRGKILRPAARLFVIFGAGHLLRNLPDEMRGIRREDR